MICKLLERLIKNHMVDFLVKYKLLNSSQHGFLKARSCFTNMLCFLDEITKWIDVGSPVDVIYLDFQKAFGKVPQYLLIAQIIGNTQTSRHRSNCLIESLFAFMYPSEIFVNIVFVHIHAASIYNNSCSHEHIHELT